jgi:hypothetical protein
MPPAAWLELPELADGTQHFLRTFLSLFVSDGRGQAITTTLCSCLRSIPHANPSHVHLFVSKPVHNVCISALRLGRVEARDALV